MTRWIGFKKLPRLQLAWIAGLLVVPLVAVLSQWPARATDRAAPLPPPEATSLPPKGDTETAVLSGGCFWGIQGVFQHVLGVRRVLSGYAGGRKETANYEEVSAGGTGHAESVQITFDPRKVSYGELLRIFFSVALDPTELNRQGPDTGTQYRSEIFYANEEQRRIAASYIAQLDRVRAFDQPIATRVDPDTGFYPAESYHQDYLILHPGSMYIVFNDLPKIANLKRLFPNEYVEDPVRVFPGGSASN
ncbi:MAG: peptide-methionine (S)-S-oxide reductase MsrA [Methylobacteriaceae bacterium]|nr:peptide-methionine (S)-S-oxide reductase MsrA [Methylobacteriaceae bacterium]MBV9705361.1 peptide-methionine (S)-S-oxide reductase MsrA [Methylobacteriaceae bacterium]